MRMGACLASTAKLKRVWIPQIDFKRMETPRREAFLTDLQTLAGVEHGPAPFHSLAAGVMDGCRTIQVSLHPCRACQWMLGFGAAMTESSAQVVWSSPRRDEILDDLFLPAARSGAGLSCLRIPIGSCDFSLDPATHHDDARAEVSFTRDCLLLVPVLTAAKQRNPNLTLIGSPWSPPSWMKTTGVLNGGSLQMEYLHAYCHHLVKVLLFFQQRDLEFYGITLQNEPFHGSASYPSMQLSTQQQAQFAKALVPVLRCNGIKTRVIGHDHDYKYKGEVLELLRLAGNVLDGTAWHAYEGTPETLLHPAIRKHGIFVTEQTGHTQRPRDANFLADIRWALINVLLVPCLHNSRCGLQWNLVLDEVFCPVLPGGPTNCRGVLEVPRNGGQHERSPEFYALAHMAHATAGAPNCWRILATTKYTGEDFLVAGFATQLGSGCSCVFFNDAADSVNVEVSSADVVVEAFHMPPHSIVSLSGLGIPTCPPAPDVPVVAVSQFDLPKSPSRFALFCEEHGTYLAAHGKENMVYQSKSDSIGTWEEWYAIELHRAREFVLKSCTHGTFIGQEGGRLTQVVSMFRAVPFVLFVDGDDVAFYSDFGCIHMPVQEGVPVLKHTKVVGPERFLVIEVLRDA